VSRNGLFIILGLIAAILTYFFHPLMVTLVELVITDKMPNDFLRLLENSDLVAFAGYMSMFGFIFFMLYLVFPVSYVWYHLISAGNIISSLPTVDNPASRTDKKMFFSKLKGLGFIEQLAMSYGPYLIQGPEEEVTAHALKNTRLIQKISNKTEKFKISPVRATAPAEMIFNLQSLVTDNLLLGFFTIFAWLTAGIGFICLGISVISFSMPQGAQEVALLSALQPGMVALLYCLLSAVIVIGIGRLIDLILSENANALARKINSLFYQGEWPQNMEEQGNAAILKQLESTLKDTLDKPMREISKAVRALSGEQEKKLDGILSKTLENFSDNMIKKLGVDLGALNKALTDSSQAAGAMKKHFSESNTAFSQQMDKQAKAIAKHLTDMQKILKNSEKTTQTGANKIISAIASEVDNTYSRLGKFMESGLARIDAKQEALETAVNDKDSILKDLHNTAKDLGTISNASGRLLEKFNALAKEMDGILTTIQTTGASKKNTNSETRDKLKLAMLDLQKANRNKISELPDM